MYVNYNLDGLELLWYKNIKCVYTEKNGYWKVDIQIRDIHL